MNKYIISEDSLRDLVRDKLVLSALNDAGVDNWSGCEMADFPDWDDINDELSNYTRYYE